MRPFSIAALVLALAALCCAPAAGAATVEVVPLDPAAAAAVPVVGADAEEEAAARAALAPVIRDLPVRRVVFSAKGHRRAVAVVLAASSASSSRASRDRWLATLTAQRIADLRYSSARPIRWIEVLPAEDGMEVTDAPLPDRSAEAVGELAARVAALADAAGWPAASVRAWQLGPGAVAVRIPLTDEQVLWGRTDWSSAVYPDAGTVGGGYSSMYEVLAPDGTVLSVGGSLGPNNGFAAYGAGARPGAAPPLPAELSGPTRLEIELTLRDASLRSRTRRYVLDCSGGPSVGVTDAQAACDRLVADRYGLLAPVLSDSTCAGGLADTASVAGTFAGRPIQRDFGNCYGSATAAWKELLRVPADVRVEAGDFASAWRTPVVGASPREQVALRRALARVPAGLGVQRLVLQGKEPRRRLVIHLAPPGPDPDSQPRRRRWLAAVAADVLVDGLGRAGTKVARVEIPAVAARWSFAGPQPRARTTVTVRRLAETLRARALGAGLHVREATAWVTGPGAVALTVRLTERQLRAGRLDWKRLVRGHAHPATGFSVLLTVEAPDGKPVRVVGYAGGVVPVAYSAPPRG